MITRGSGPLWPAPTCGLVKLSVDGSYGEDGSAGAGMVLRDEAGAVIFSSCRQLFSCPEALEAELCACMEGLSFAIHRSERPIEVEMDSLVAVKLIQANEVDRLAYTSLIKEFKYLMSLHESSITHLKRSQNKVV